ncbi:MAG TPA: hypothetical protein VK359_07800 [Rubrobacteraceae bacterium]|nr:hypothetical protein [Rubrobacteraceae bacterium]HLL57812.1 hypothetical protein [Rubrobacteraceae bacterium]
MLDEDAGGLRDGEPTRVDEELLAKTLNFRLLDEGMAYYTVYTSTPVIHRRYLRGVAAKAREADRGIWAADTTASFALDDQDSIGPDGQLILPKLFRRCTLLSPGSRPPPPSRSGCASARPSRHCPGPGSPANAGSPT